MPTAFPGGLDNFTNPTPADDLNTPAVLHSDEHANANDAIEALEAWVGVSGSAVTPTHEYRIKQLEAIPPGAAQFGMAGQDEGVPLGTGTILNVVGDDVVLSRSGTVLRLLHTNPAIVFPQEVIGIFGQDEGINLGTGTILNVVGDNVSLSLSGTTLTLVHTNPTITFPQEVIGVFGQDKGVPLGTGSIFNVNGSRLTFSISGTSLELSNSPDPQDNIGIMAYDDAAAVGTGTVVSFGGNLTVVRTGTVLFVDATASQGGGGQIGIMGQDEGTLIGTGTTLNVVGDDVVLSISGSVLRLLHTNPTIVFPQEVIGIFGQDEGINLGTGTILNVTGDRATLTRSGTVLNLNISTEPLDNLGFVGQDEGVPLGTGTTLNVVGNNIVMSLSGTVLNITHTDTPVTFPQELIGFAGQDEGIALGTGTTLNVMGSRLTLSLSGTVLQLTSSPDPLDNIGIMGWDEGIGAGTGTILNVVGAGAALTRSGTVLNLSVPQIQPANTVLLPKITGSYYTNEEEANTLLHSNGVLNGDLVYVTRDDSTHVSVAAGEGLLRVSGSVMAELDFIKWDASGSIAIPLSTGGVDTVRYLGIEYNSGNPQVSVRTTFNWNWLSDFPLARVSQDGTDLRILNAYAHAGDTPSKTRRVLRLTHPFIREEPPEGTGGLIIGDKPTRGITMTAGNVWHGFNRYVLSALDTTVSDSFDAHYRNVAGGFTHVTGSTQWGNTQYDDGSGALATLTNNRYGVHWIYVDASDGTLDLVYGRGNYTSLTNAQAEGVPATIPGHLSAHGRLLGRILFQKSASVAASVESAFAATFVSAGTSNHNDLSNIQGGAVGDNYHLTSGSYAGLIGGATTALHFHTIGQDQIGFMGQSNGINLGTGTIFNVNGTRLTFSISGTSLELSNSPDPVELIGIYGQDEGLNLGTGTVLNVTGDNIVLSLSGTVLNLAHTNPTITFPQEVIGIMGQDEGVPLGTGTTLNVVGGRLTLSLSGTVLNLSIPALPAEQIGVMTKDEGANIGTGTVYNFVGGGIVTSLSGTEVRVFSPGDFNIQFFLGDGANVISTGSTSAGYAYVDVPVDCSIASWEVLADATGSIVTNVFKSTYAGFPPTVPLAGLGQAVLTNQRANIGNATGTAALLKTDVLLISVSSAATIKNATVSLRANKTATS